MVSSLLSVKMVFVTEEDSSEISSMCTTIDAQIEFSLDRVSMLILVSLYYSSVCLSHRRHGPDGAQLLSLPLSLKTQLFILTFWHLYNFSFFFSFLEDRLDPYLV